MNPGAGVAWEAVFLGVIALAVVVMAAIQIGAIIFAARVARRVDRLAIDFEHEIKPLLVNLQAMSTDAARAAALATAQVERVDRLFAELGSRIERILDTVQQTLLGPARDGVAVLTGIRAALSAFRELRDQAQARRRPAGAEEEDPLFIG